MRHAKPALLFLSASVVILTTVLPARAQLAADPDNERLAPWAHRHQRSSDEAQLTTSGQTSSTAAAPRERDSQSQRAGSKVGASPDGQGNGQRRRPPNLDTSGDGTVDLSEFKAIDHPKRPDGKTDEEVFKQIDANGDGKITQDEFRKMAPPRGPRRRPS